MVKTYTEQAKELIKEIEKVKINPIAVICLAKQINQFEQDLQGFLEILKAGKKMGYLLYTKNIIDISNALEIISKLRKDTII